MASSSDQQVNTGFSNNPNAEANRLSNKDGSYNVRYKGVTFWERHSLLHTLLEMSNFRFLLLVMGYYLFVNVLFAGLYVWIGTDQLGGNDTGPDGLPAFLQAFFFSAQTITTVGYGHVHPIGVLANMAAALESFIGILTFAVVTGVVYARFSRPKAFLRFSDQALVSPFRGGQALMFRLSGFKNNSLTEVNARVVVSLHVDEPGGESTRFFNLPLDIDSISSLTTSWTIVHPIDEHSPIHGLDREELIRRKAEFLVRISAIDEHLSYTVQQKTSYLGSEIIFGASFEPMVSRSEDGQYSVIQLDKLNKFRTYQDNSFKG